MEIKSYEGILCHVDKNGNVHQLFPIVNTDKELKRSNIPADAAAVGVELKKCFQSVSDGKALVASAITDKRVPTDATATFAQMAENIMKIVLGSGNATAGDVLAGKTFTNDDGVEYEGTMPNNSAGSYSIDRSGTCVIPKGYYDGTTVVTSDVIKQRILSPLENTLLGLTENSTWDEIVDGLHSLFPESLNLLTYFTIDNWKVSYDDDGGYTDIYTNSSRVQFKIGKDQQSEKKLTAISDDINISSFSTFNHTVGNAGDKASANNVIGTYTAQLICADGTTYDISGDGIKNIADKTGNAYIKFTATSGWISSARGYTNCGVYATVLRFDA